MTDFDVRNEQIEELLRDLGRKLKASMPPGWGFALLILELNVDDGSAFYASSADRQGVIHSIEQFLEKLRQGV